MQDYLTIVVHPKEIIPKEREIVPRGFSLIPIALKLYMGYTELLLSENVIPLIDEITMTDTALKLQKK